MLLSYKLIHNRFNFDLNIFKFSKKSFTKKYIVKKG